MPEHSPFERDLTEQLQRAAHRPEGADSTDYASLVTRGQRLHRRQRTIRGVAAVGALAAVAVTAVGVGSLLRPDAEPVSVATSPTQAPPASPATSAPSSSPATPTYRGQYTAAQALTACAPQIDAAMQAFGPEAPPSARIEPGTYRAGQVVQVLRGGKAFQGLRVPLVLCGLPTKDRTAEEVLNPPFSDTKAVLEVCAAQSQPEAPVTREQLAGGRLRATDEAEGVRVAVITTPTDSWSCAWGAPLNTGGTLQPAVESVVTTSAVTVVDPRPGTVASGAGIAPKGAAAVRLRYPDGTTRVRDLVDGTWAVAAYSKDTGPVNTEQVTIEALDAQGTVIPNPTNEGVR